MVVTVLPMMRRSGELAGIAVVDYEDFRWASAHRWSMRGDYVARSSDRRLLHRIIMGLGPAGPPTSGRVEVDHRDRDPLNNRRSNLRVVTRAQNAQNVSVQKNNASGHRGVAVDPTRRKWRASVMIAGRRHNLGRFDSATDAARVVAAFRARHMPFSED